MSLRRTALFESHRELGGRMVEFGGFEMPLQYSSIKKEHRAVREAAGLFDVSHMGQIHLTGPGAVESAERLLSCRVADLKQQGVRYGVLCNESGGVVDDVTLYRVAEDVLFLCVNASNIEKDLDWVRRHVVDATEVYDASVETGLLALQGPRRSRILAEVAERGVADIGRFSFAPCLLDGVEALASRTGYTGSDGFEVYLGAGDLKRVFGMLLDAGRDQGLEPCGLGARDTLRLEAALPLYGHELDETTSPLEAGLERFVKRDVGGFIGAEAIEERAARGPLRQLVGFEMSGRGIARADYAVHFEGAAVGRVTSGGPSPTLGTHIGLAYVPPACAAPGTRLEIEVRGRPVEARVVETPFVRARAATAPRKAAPPKSAAKKKPASRNEKS